MRLLKIFKITKILALLCTSILADNSYAGEKATASLFQVTLQDSPVKGKFATFLVKAPKGLRILSAEYKVENASILFSKENSYMPATLVEQNTGKELRISVDSYSNGFYKLYIRIQTDSKVKIIYKSINHDYVKFVVDNKPSDVPEPDRDKNNSTLLGIDSDNDGVRDDVQNWINKKATNSDVHLALRQLAIAENNRLLFVSDKEKSITANHLAIRARRCHREMQNKSASLVSSKLIHNEMDALFTNTRQRIEASRAASRNFHGETVESSSRNADLLCDF